MLEKTSISAITQIKKKRQIKIKLFRVFDIIIFGLRPEFRLAFHRLLVVSQYGKREALLGCVCRNFKSNLNP